jgi:hypothetical protein
MTARPMTELNPYHRALNVLQRLNNAELTEAYRRFTTRIESILSPEEVITFASYQQRTTGGIRPEEQAVADKVAADAEVISLYEQYINLLTSHQGDGGGRAAKVYNT